jgi:general secretion pathway protein D
MTMFRNSGWTAVATVALAAGTACALKAQASAPSAAAMSESSGAGAAASETAAAGTSAKEAQHPASKHDRAQAARLFVQGAKAMEQDRIGAALDAFTRAAELDPAEKKYEVADQIAKAHLVTELIQQADKDRILGHANAAREKIAKAYAIDPASPEVAQHMYELATAAVAGEPATRSDEVGVAAPIVLEARGDRKSFHLRASKRSVIQQVLQAYGITATLDDSVDGQVIRYDVDDARWEAAQRALQLATGTFIVPLDPVRALIAKDTRQNRDKLERLAAETVYMPGMSSGEMTEIANAVKNVFGLRTAVVNVSKGTLTVRGRTDEVNALNATLESLLEGRSEVQLDVQMFEVDRTKAVNLGAILPSQTTLFNVYSEARNILNSNASTVQEIISSGLAAPGDWEAILAILIASGQLSNTVLNQPFGVFGGGLTLTGIAYQGGSLNMKLNSSDVRVLDQLQLRVLDREEGTIKAGERYPIETSSYSSLGGSTNLNIPGLSTAGLSSTLSSLGISASQLQAAETATIPQVEYQDIGLSMVVTPTIESTDRVSMKFHLTLSALAGSSINSLPILTNREYNAITSVKVGETALLVSSLTRQESNAITGIPGLSDLPGFQDATNKNSNVDIGELAIVITPHIVRSVKRGAQEKMILLPVGESRPQ